MKKLSLHSYDIIIEQNSIKKLDKYIDNSRKIIITDTNIYKLGLVDQLNIENIIDVIVIEAGEKSKSFTTTMEIIERLQQLNVDRSDTIIAFGGGVVGDISGFVASIYMRGIKYIQIPTTLLAMVDSSVGAKTAINFNGVKNNVGSFYRPTAVIIDSTLLNTLDVRNVNNGVAEIIKCGAIADISIIEDLEKQSLNEIIDNIIYKSVKVKADIVAEDEREQGIRTLLNFGHTLGHALESNGDFKTYLHGECVAAGMIAFTIITEEKKRLLKLLSKYNLGKIDYKVENIFIFIKSDKKVSSSLIKIVKVERLGQAQIETITLDELYKFLGGAYG